MDEFQKLGQKLKQLRQSHNISIETISNKTKISIKVLNILENGERKSFFAPVFMEGFLRSYLESIGENPSELTGELRSIFRKEEKVKEEIAKKKVEHSRAIKKKIIYLCGIILIIGLIIYVALNLFNRSNIGNSKKQTVSKSYFKTPDSSKNSKNLNANITQAKKYRKSKQESNYFVFKVIAGKRSWIFYKIDGKTSNSGFIKAGKTITLKAKNHLLATLGNSIDMRIFFNGKQILIPKRVIHIKCDKSSCTILSAKEWQNIIFEGK